MGRGDNSFGISTFHQALFTFCFMQLFDLMHPESPRGTARTQEDDN